MLNTGYKPENKRKKLHAILNNHYDIYNKGKAALNKLVGIK